MQILFLLPAIQDVPTGGNVYNSEIIARLRRRHRITTLELQEGVQPALALVEAHDVVIVDSLLASHISNDLLKASRGGHDGGAESSDKNRKGNPTWLLLVHYLSQCDPTRPQGNDPLPAVLQAYDGFITTSQYSKECLHRLGFSQASIAVVYPGLSAVYFDAIQPVRKEGRDKSCKILTVSSLLPGKGLTACVDLFEALSEKNWQWDIVGSDALDIDYATAFKARIATSKATDRICWKGSIASEQMPALYKAYDVFVLPSRFETLGMALREAMASGLPILAYDVGGVSESLVAGGGFLVPPFDRKMFDRHLRDLIENAATRRMHGVKAWNISRSFPSWDSSVDVLDAFFAGMV